MSSAYILLAKTQLSRVYYVLDGNHGYILKKIKFSTEIIRSKFQSEVSIMQEIKDLGGHISLAHMESYFIDVDYGYIRMKYISGTDLETVYTHYIKPDLYKILKDVANGLKFLHSVVKILHLDIKPRNIMVVDCSGILIDYGVSEKICNSVKTFCGTPYYASPEVWKTKNIGVWSDIYSLGVTFYFVLSNGKLPYNINSVADGLKMFSDEHNVPQAYTISHYGDPVYIMTMKMIDPHIMKRPTIDDIITLFSSPARASQV